MDDGVIDSKSGGEKGKVDGLGVRIYEKEKKLRFLLTIVSFRDSPYICARGCIHTRTHMYVRMYICMYVYIYIHIYI